MDLCLLCLRPVSMEINRAQVMVGDFVQTPHSGLAALVLCFASARCTDHVVFSRGVRKGDNAWFGSGLGDLSVQPSRYLLAKAIIWGGLRIHSSSIQSSILQRSSKEGRFDYELAKAQGTRVVAHFQLKAIVAVSPKRPWNCEASKSVWSRAKLSVQRNSKTPSECHGELVRFGAFRNRACHKTGGFSKDPDTRTLQACLNNNQQRTPSAGPTPMVVLENNCYIARFWGFNDKDWKNSFRPQETAPCRQ